MINVMVQVSVKEQAAWKAAFEAAAGLRKSFGSTGVRAFAKAENPNEVIIIGDYEDLERAKQMFQSEEFRSALQKAGVNSPPVVTFLSEILKLDS
jgi:quinol monooxygenase YgiN